MHSREEILESICKHLENIAGAGPDIQGETNIVERFALDSVKVLDLIMEIEDEFDLSVPLNLMADVQTVNDLADIILKIESGR
jgi:acyl carrier protein